eukprot:TRINITY_DN899_c0_g1_i1.p1 TRINITY_DN899_c0_g1~~TRINITY_DN899_c0_g1_i1.p1  ORF type:complete len:171 (-),score=30.04 TRINITY_DN899_c0_g1_i1:55-567(-)
MPGSSDDEVETMTKVKYHVKSYAPHAARAALATLALAVYFVIVLRHPLSLWWVLVPGLAATAVFLTLSYANAMKAAVKRLFTNERVRAAQSAVRRLKEADKSLTVEQVTENQNKVTFQEASNYSVFFVSSIMLGTFLVMNLVIFSKYSVPVNMFFSCVVSSFITLISSTA